MTDEQRPQQGLGQPSLNQQILDNIPAQAPPLPPVSAAQLPDVEVSSPDGLVHVTAAGSTGQVEAITIKRMDDIAAVEAALVPTLNQALAKVRGEYAVEADLDAKMAAFDATMDALMGQIDSLGPKLDALEAIVDQYSAEIADSGHPEATR